jgi:hypothetical protein
MRNACAHSGRAISFDLPELRDVAKALLAYLTDEEINPTNPLAMRIYVAWAAGWLIRYLSTGSKEEANALVGELLKDTLTEVRKANDAHEASLKKRRERYAFKRQSSRKV